MMKIILFPVTDFTLRLWRPYNIKLWKGNFRMIASSVVICTSNVTMLDLIQMLAGYEYFKLHRGNYHVQFERICKWLCKLLYYVSGNNSLSLTKKQFLEQNKSPQIKVEWIPLLDYSEFVHWWRGKEYQICIPWEELWKPVQCKVYSCWPGIRSG